jgi:hypothetical protein
VGSDLLLIGANGDDTGATNSGAAYLFSTDGALLTTFTNPFPANGDNFGVAVAGLGRDRVLIGAYGGATNVGAAYLFRTDGVLLTTFTNPTPAAGDVFGYRVAAVGSDRVLIGAYGDDTGAAQAGAAYLFNTNGTLLTTFTNPAPAVNDNFGWAVAVVGSDRVLISAYGDDTGASGAGAAYLFTTDGTWVTTFTNPTPVLEDSFGISVAAVGSDRVLIGAMRDDTGAPDAGAAYLFRTNGTLLTTFTNPNPANSDWFGFAVAAVGSDRVLIGMRPDEAGGTKAGAAYLFSTNGTLLTTFTNPIPTGGGQFGNAVAAVGTDRVLIGARRDDTGATDAGAAYLFSVETFTPGLVADAVRHGSITTASLADGAVTAAKIGGVLLPSQIPDLDASKITSGTVPAAALSNAWRTGGNAGATPGANFLGTTDTNALDFKVNNQRGLRLEPGGSNSVNVIGGWMGNGVTPGVAGATIGGGGSGDYFGVAHTNRVEASFGTVSGGGGNTIQPTATHATIGGGNNNSIRLNALSATIAGGNNNTIQTNAFDATIGGGIQNRIETDARFSTIGGGVQNTIQPNGEYATIPGGLENSATNYAFAAGTFAKANHTGAFVWADSTLTEFASTASNQFLIRAGGGVGINKPNPATALDVNGTVTATSLNGTAGTTLTLGTADPNALEFKVNGTRALRLEPTASTDTVNVIGGSARNFVAAGVVGATIGGGGSGNHYGGSFGVAYTNRVEADFSTVSGGRQNRIASNSDDATIGGGFQNTIESFNNIFAPVGATISGGRFNTIQNETDSATIGGGDFNTIQKFAARATIGGGAQNTNSGSLATIGGGWNNTIQPYAASATIGGGDFNTIQPNGHWATIPGGVGNSATNQAFAVGTDAKANHTGAFVWADSFGGAFASTANDQFSIRAHGGVRLSDNTPNLSFGTTPRQMLNLYSTNYGIGVQAATLYFRCDASPGVPFAGFRWYKGGAHNDATGNTGGGTELMSLASGYLYVNGTFVSSSDRNAKENFAPVQPCEVLEKVVTLPLLSWNYKTDTTSRHLGPMAQDFHAAFGLGTDDKHIATVDADGVALAAIQGLNQKVEVRSQRSEDSIQKLQAENAELKQRLEKLERLMNRQNGGAR